jgi:hypothetical protein
MFQEKILFLMRGGSQCDVHLERVEVGLTTTKILIKKVSKDKNYLFFSWKLISHCLIYLEN